jgi:hypothetical protein
MTDTITSAVSAAQIIRPEHLPHCPEEQFPLGPPLLNRLICPAQPHGPLIWQTTGSEQAALLIPNIRTAREWSRVCPQPDRADLDAGEDRRAAGTAQADTAVVAGCRAIQAVPARV